MPLSQGDQEREPAPFFVTRFFLERERTGIGEVAFFFSPGFLEATFLAGFATALSGVRLAGADGASFLPATEAVFMEILTLALVGGTPEDEKLADHLDAGGAELFGDFGVDGLKFLAVVGRNADLDELVVVEGAVDFVKNGVGEAVGAEKDDRVKMVGLGTKGQTRIARENDFFHNKRMCPRGASKGSARSGGLINKVGWGKYACSNQKTALQPRLDRTSHQ